ncbi:MAG: hypothetical protein VX278_17095 [Myxococcota bacterium]|nr:hypothetical protein [Myxococcota bacterium]
MMRERLFQGSILVGGLVYGCLLYFYYAYAGVQLIILWATYTISFGALFFRQRGDFSYQVWTAKMAIGALGLPVAASILVFLSTAMKHGSLVQIASHWTYLVSGLGGAFLSFLSWNHAKPKVSSKVAPTKEFTLEPAPPVEVGATVDWGTLTGTLIAKEDLTRLKSLRVLQRIQVILQQHSSPNEDALRIIKQESERLVADSIAESKGREEGDALTQAAQLLEWGIQKLPELAELDVADLLMAKVIAEIQSHHSSVENLFVDHRSLKAIHPIDRKTADDKCNQRADAARAALQVLKANNMRLSEDLIASNAQLEAFQSVTGIQVVEIPNGYVTFEGNGRREAIQRAYQDTESVFVEVRVYRFNDVKKQRDIVRQIERVRKWKKVQDTI